VIYVITHEVGQRIRELRNNQNLSQEKLALKAEIDCTYLAGIENGKRNISIINLEKIAKALEINMYDFFEFKKGC
jgi:transcriptional regulator with XRE-family HTH domain